MRTAGAPRCRALSACRPCMWDVRGLLEGLPLAPSFFCILLTHTGITPFGCIDIIDISNIYTTKHTLITTAWRSVLHSTWSTTAPRGAEQTPGLWYRTQTGADQSTLQSTLSDRRRQRANTNQYKRPVLAAHSHSGVEPGSWSS